jgi:hypothetical protein
MALGSVQVSAGAIGVGAFPQIEGVALFIGVSVTGQGALNPIGQSSDIDTIFGAGNLADTLEVAKVNGSSTFQAYAIGHDDLEDWTDVIDAALAGCQPELIVICTPVTSAAELTAMQTKAAALLNLNRRVIFLAAYTGINPATQTWAQYLTAAQAITTGVAGQRVFVTPLLFGGELGSFAGRITRIKVARSPMRVKDGPAIDPGTAPVDTDDVPLSRATRVALDAARFSVLDLHEGKEGVYFGDANTLETTGGDFPVMEWLRTADKAARRVRLVALDAIADDDVENTPAGNAAFGTRLSSPLRTMASPSVREIRALAKDAITVVWSNVTNVTIYMKFQVLNAPKTITIPITLDTATA